MPYRVDLSARAARDLDHLYMSIHAAESLVAARWYNGLEKRIYSLERMPQRCPIAPEGQRTRRPLRHLLYGKRRRAYRVIFEIDDLEKTVNVLTIRHWAMDQAQASELD